MLERVAVDAQAAAFAPVERACCGAGPREFDGEDHAALADFGDVRVIREQCATRRPRCGGERAVALEHGLVAKMSSVASAAAQASGLPV